MNNSAMHISEIIELMERIFEESEMSETTHNRTLKMKSASAICDRIWGVDTISIL